MSSPADLLQRRWVLLIGFLLLVGVLLWNGREQPIKPGDRVEFTFTLVPPDAGGLACALPDPLSGAQCGFSLDGAPAPVDHALRPYTTTTGEIVLLSGVFEDSAVQKWLAQAGTTNDDKRVTVHCDGTFLGRAPSAKVRWAADGQFADAEELRGGKIGTCRVTPGG